MKPFECEFEEDAFTAALQGRWPQRVDAELRAHIDGCAVCTDIVSITAAFDEAREQTAARADVPDSGRVWWRAQLRARREAAEAAGRPITAAQVIAFAAAMGLFGACFGALSTRFQAVLRWAVAGVAGIDFKTWLPAASALLAEHGALVLAMAAMLILIPAAVFVVIGRE